MAAFSVGLLIIACPRVAHAESSAISEREAFLNERRALMIGMSAWSVLNIIGGTLLIAHDPFHRDPTRQQRAFRQSFGAMALAYGLVNATLAFGTLAGIPNQRERLQTVGQTQFQRNQSANVLVANVGVEMLTVGVGACLWGWGPSATARGTGAGFMVQSGFLVGFDSMGSVVYRY